MAGLILPFNLSFPRAKEALPAMSYPQFKTIVAVNAVRRPQPLPRLA
jgi:hypothetical protein